MKFEFTFFSAVFSLLDKILKSELQVDIHYHQTTHRVAFYITASYEKYSYLF